MKDFFALLCILGLLSVIFWLSKQRERADRVRLRASFDALRFQTEDGELRGDALTVVKQVAFQQREANTRLQARMGETFWYCIGPRKSYWLAMPMTMPDNHQVQWVVRPLSEARMRGALAGDRRASKLAFGQAVDA